MSRAKSHPTAADAVLLIEVGDTERKPRKKIPEYMRDGRIPVAWRVDLPRGCVEILNPRTSEEPVSILYDNNEFRFADVVFTLDEIFATVLHR